jgi:hypothetical protein
MRIEAGNITAQSDLDRSAIRRFFRRFGSREAEADSRDASHRTTGQG